MPESKDEFSPRLKDAIAYSREEALTLGHDHIGTEHLLLGMLKDGSGEAISILQNLNLNFENLHKELDNLLPKNKESVSLPNSTIHLTRQAERALKTTFLEAKLFQSKSINTAHLLLCILRNENDSTTKLLNKLNIDYDNVKDEFKIISNYEDRESLESPIFEKENPFIEKYAFREDNRDPYGKGIYLKIEKNKDEEIIYCKDYLQRNSKLKGLLKLKNLHHLEINNTQEFETQSISKLTTLKSVSLRNTTLQNYNFLVRLLNLEILRISSSNIEDLTFITKLINLKEVYLQKNSITILPVFDNLKKIEILDISYNNIPDISNIENIVDKINLLLINNNPIELLSERIILKILDNNINNINLEYIRALKTVIVWQQKYEKAAFLRDIEKRLERKIEIDESDKQKVKDIYIDTCLEGLHLISPPIHIVKAGVEDLKIYFRDLDAEPSQKFLYEGKLLIIGEGGVGKTSFARKMKNTNADLPTDKETTFNIDISQINFKLKDEKERLFINLWDFGGQKIYKGTHQMFFSERCLYVLVDDNREEKTDFSFWINTILQLGGEECSILIVINKKHGHKNISFDESGYRSQFGQVIKAVLPLDLSEDTYEIDFLRETLKKEFKDLPLIGSPLPPSWVEIRNDLSRIKKNYISYEKFTEICFKNKVEDTETINTLCAYLDNIGVFTYYPNDPLLKERIYLNSNWLVKTIYEVLDNEEIDANNGRINSDVVKRVWKDKELDHEVDRLCALMKRFGLMYYILETDEFVIPEKLPKEMPYKTWKYANEQILHFTYEFDQYNPKGIMSKLIVSLHTYISDQNLVWHRGVNLKFENSYAQIIETYTSQNRFEIKIVGENKKVLLALIIDHFDRLLKPYKNLKFEKKVQCICKECIDSENPEFFKYSSLLKRREKGKSFIECEKDYIEVDVIELLDGITKEKNKMKKIRIFLASSGELKNDRERVERFINRQNKSLIDQDIFLELNIWEDFLDAMSRSRLQNEYNKVIKKCDVFVSLFGSKIGKYTEEEFEVAYNAFQEKGKPKYIYTYFKDGNIKQSSIKKEDFLSLENFKEKLDALGHFYTPYNNDDDLERQLKIQLDKILLEEKK